MNIVPLIIALLVIVTITVQVAAFFITLRIRRNSAALDEDEEE